MKKTKQLLSILLIMSIGFYMGCKGDDNNPDPSADRIAELMNGGTTWNLLSVTKDGFDVSSQFDGFTLTINKFTYTTTKGLSSVWASDGIWEFNDGNLNVIKRDDGTLINIALSGDQLTLQFVSPETSGGRLESVEGEYIFIME